MSSRAPIRLLSLLLLALAWACGTTTEPEDDGSGGETGSVTVSATTTGENLDTEYSVTIGSLNGTVGANGSVTIANVPVGTASVQLGGIAANCAVNGSNPLAVTVTDGATATGAFAVECSALGGASSLIAQAITSMEEALFTALNIDDVGGLDSFSFAESNELFNQALALSPANDTASLGAALTGIFMLEDNSDVRAVVDDWDAWTHDDPIVAPHLTLLGPAIETIRDPLTLPLDFSASKVEQIALLGAEAAEIATGPMRTHEPPPSVTDIQAVLGDVVLPALTSALDHLSDVSPSLIFTVTEAMQGEDALDADPLELDYTEVLALQAGLNAAIAAIDVGIAYTLTPSPLSAEGFVEAMSPSSTFLTLATGGAARMADALSRLQATGPLLLSGLDALEDEADDQTDDIIKFDATGMGDGLTAQDIADARAVITDVTEALAGPTPVTVREGELDEYTFALDVGEFFTDPIADFKAMLPAYSVFTAEEDGEAEAFFRWMALDLDDWTFPDPTFSGVFPDFSATQDILDLEDDVSDIYFEFRLGEGYYRLITIDDVDCDADFAGGGQGCGVGGDFYRNGSVSLEQNVFFQVSGQSASLFGFGDTSYVLTHNMDDTFTLGMEFEVDSTPVVIDATLVDMPGFTSYDTFGRARGGSTLEFTYLGAVWVFERQ